jgi:hypothetical protein
MQARDPAPSAALGSGSVAENPAALALEAATEAKTSPGASPAPSGAIGSPSSAGVQTPEFADSKEISSTLPSSAPREESKAVVAPRVELPRTTASPDELGLAGLILYHPREVPGFLDGPGKQLPSDRKRLAMALHRFLLGPEAECRRLVEDLISDGELRGEEVAYLRRALTHPGSAIEPPEGPSSPMLVAASLGRLAAAAEEHLSAGRTKSAALAYGQLLQGALDAPWSADRASLQAWSDGLAKAQASYRWSPAGDWPGVTAQVVSGDSLISVRKRVLETHADLLVCTGEIERANAMRGRVLQPGDVLKIPIAHANVLVDLDSRWLLYRMDSEVVSAWEVGIGRPGNETPPGQYRAGEKTKEPMWFRAGNKPVPYGDPENPLGSRWIAWAALDGRNTGLGFHGTQDPTSIGEDRSQGCGRRVRRSS